MNRPPPALYLPDLYDYIQLADNNIQQDPAHHHDIQYARAHVGRVPRPLSNVKIYGEAARPTRTYKDGMAPLLAQPVRGRGPPPGSTRSTSPSVSPPSA